MTDTPTRLAEALYPHLARDPDELPWRFTEDGDEFDRLVLARDGGLTVSATRWEPDESSCLHGYEPLGGLLHVASGMLEVECYLPRDDGFEYRVLHIRRGHQAYLPAGGLWRLEAVTRAVTIQAEYPAITALEPAVLSGLVGARRFKPRRRSLAEWLRFLGQRDGLTAA